MDIKTLKQKFDIASKDLIDAGAELGVNDTTFIRIYIKMFGEWPNIIGLDSDGYYLNPEAETMDSEEDDENEYVEDNDDTKIYTFENLFIQQTIINIVNAYKNKAYILRYDEYPIIIADHLIIFYSNYFHQIFIIQQDPVLSEEFKSLVVDEKVNNKCRWFSYVTNNSHGFNTTAMKVKKQEHMDLNMNYNDDLPHEQIVNFIKSNDSGLLLLHGEPGTGKTTYIRNLMYELKGRDFMVLDPTVFNYITDASFIDLLTENRNCVVILEDCESMLADRVAGNNKLSTLLNLSDGLVGDSFNLKFICTFNANVTQLDKALLRKGRMKVKYEFKALAADKVQALAKVLGKDIPEGKAMPLSEIFNYGEDNGNKQETKKIGFGK